MKPSINVDASVSFKNSLWSLKKGLSTLKKTIENKYPEYSVRIDTLSSNGTSETHSMAWLTIEGSDEPTNELFSRYTLDMDVTAGGWYVGDNPSGSSMKEIKEAVLADIELHEQDRFDV